MSLIRNQFGSVNNPSHTITHSLTKSACCKLLSVLQLKTLLTITVGLIAVNVASDNEYFYDFYAIVCYSLIPLCGKGSHI